MRIAWNVEWTDAAGDFELDIILLLKFAIEKSRDFCKRIFNWKNFPLKALYTYTHMYICMCAVINFNLAPIMEHSLSSAFYSMRSASITCCLANLHATFKCNLQTFITLTIWIYICVYMCVQKYIICIFTFLYKPNYIEIVSFYRH